MGLVLTRFPLQSFTIGPDITITVVEVKGRMVRLKIDAPRELDISRDNMKGGPEEPVEEA